MDRLPLGMIILVAASVLVYFGLAQRLLDRMRLSDKGALGIIAALIVGSFIDIPLLRGNTQISVNVGGALVPLGLAAYLVSKTGSKKEITRTIVATLATAGIIYILGSVIMTGEVRDRTTYLDPLYVYPLVGGSVAYLLGRSRRAAFVAATIGVLLLDIIHLIWLNVTGTPGNVNIGGAGVFDSIVVAGLVAVLIAEIIGETRERLQGGPETRGRDPELVSNLQDLDKKHEQDEKKDGEDR